MKYLIRIALLLFAAALTLSILIECGTGGRIFPANEAKKQAKTDTPENTDRAPEKTAEQEAVSPTYDDAGFRVTAYIKVKSLKDTKSFDASHLADVTDIILIGDAGFDSAGVVSVGDSFAAAVKNIQDLTEGLPVRVHAALVGPGPAIDGGSRKQRMDSMAEEHKKAFDSGILEENILSLLRRYDLDGISFDYEYPLSETAKIQFGNFLVSLRQTLGGRYALGIAVSGGCADFPAESIDAVDMVELMSYDLWDDDGMHATLEIAQEDVRKLLDLGYPPEKIDLGIPFYARTTTREKVWYSYNSFYDRLDDEGLYYEAGTGLIHSFNTKKTVYDKTAWAIRQGLGGVMVWHYACDVPADNEYSLFKAIVKAKSENR